MSDLLGTYVDLLLSALSLAIFGRVLMSWISPTGNDPISSILFQITEPILRPIRQFMPRMGMIDLTPMVALIVLNFLVRPLLQSLL